MRVCTALVVIVILTFFSDVGVGQNVSVTDYDVAISSAKDLRFDVNYAFDHQGDSTRVDQGFGTIASISPCLIFSSSRNWRTFPRKEMKLLLTTQ